MTPTFPFDPIIFDITTKTSHRAKLILSCFTSRTLIFLILLLFGAIRKIESAEEVHQKINWHV